MKRLLREPLLRFLLMGAALFAVFSYRQRMRTPASPSTQIQLSLDDLAQLALLFEAQWKREPTAAELERLIETRVQMEILYREALALGLDRNDEIVKRRMAQKMQFLAEDAVPRDPTIAELRSWYAKNADKFAMPRRVSFRHLYFSPDRRGENARDDAAKALAQLTGQPEDSRLAEPLADPFMFQEYYRDRGPDSLGKEFGPRFAQAVSTLPTGSWHGPIESGFGWHLVFVDTAIPGRVPEFEEVEPDVKTAWLGEQKALNWQMAYQAIRARYTVLLPEPPDGAGAAAAQVANLSPAGADSSSGRPR